MSNILATFLAKLVTPFTYKWCLLSASVWWTLRMIIQANRLTYEQYQFWWCCNLMASVVMVEVLWGFNWIQHNDRLL